MGSNADRGPSRGEGGFGDLGPKLKRILIGGGLLLASPIDEQPRRLAAGGPNLNVTVYNTGALLGALFHSMGAVVSLTGRTGVKPADGAKRTLAAAYVGVIAFVIGFSLAALSNPSPLAGSTGSCCDPAP